MCQLAHYYSYSKYSKSACAFELSEVATAYNPKIIPVKPPAVSVPYIARVHFIQFAEILSIRSILKRIKLIVTFYTKLKVSFIGNIGRNHVIRTVIITNSRCIDTAPDAGPLK